MRRTGFSLILSAFFHFILLAALSFLLRDAKPDAYGAVMRVSLGFAAETPGAGEPDISETPGAEDAQAPPETPEPLGEPEPLPEQEPSEQTLPEPAVTVAEPPREQIPPKPEPELEPPKPIPPKPAAEPPKPKPVKPPVKPAEPKPKPAPKPAGPPSAPPAEAKPAENAANRGGTDTPSPPGLKQPPAQPGGRETSAPAASRPSGPVNIEDGSLKVIKKVPSEYPALSRKRREEGVVVLLADIASGRTESVRVEQSSGHPRLDEAAMRAVKEWRFDTSSYGPRVTARIPFRFELK
jgi:protein TonB